LLVGVIDVDIEQIRLLSDCELLNLSDYLQTEEYKMVLKERGFDPDIVFSIKDKDKLYKKIMERIKEGQE
jgi:hypothetical protein